MNPLVFNGEKLIPSVTRVFSKSARSARVPPGIPARGDRDAAAGRGRRVLSGRREGLRDGAAGRRRRAEPEDQGGAAAVHHSARGHSRPAATSARSRSSIRPARKPPSGARRSSSFRNTKITRRDSEDLTKIHEGLVLLKFVHASACRTADSRSRICSRIPKAATMPRCIGRRRRRRFTFCSRRAR